MTEKCFRHPRRPAVDQWKICSDGRWHHICRECDLELNKIGLQWAYPKTWKPKLEAYRKRVEAAE